MSTSDEIVAKGKLDELFNHESKTIRKSSSTEDLQDVSCSELPADVKIKPKIVREVVTLGDDPNEVCFSFKVVILSILFILPEEFLDTMSFYRTTSAAYSVFLVQIASHWCGKWLAKALPNKRIGFAKLKLNLNPGPWPIK